jgi:hypothetical protein
MIRKSLSRTEAVLGKDHPNVATLVNNLAVWLKSQGKGEEAEPLYIRALKIREKALGANHPKVRRNQNTNLRKIDNENALK